MAELEVDRPRSVAIIPLGGGSIIGMEQAGIETIAAAELDEGWTANVRLNRPDIPYVTELDEWEAWAESIREERPTVVHGIPPCQGVSGMSRASSADSPKNQWLLRATHATTIIRPDFALFENVPRMLSIGRPVVNEMQDIARAGGYTVTVHRHSVGSFGVCQRRKRVLFVMEPKGKERAWPSHPAVTPPRLWDVIGDLDGIEPRDGIDGDPVFAYTSPPETDWQEALRNPDGYTWNHDFSPVPEHFDRIPEGKPWMEMPAEHMTEKERARLDEGRLYNACETYRLHTGRVAGTVTGARRFMHPTRVRLLSTREASRLMAYPDSWRWAKPKEWQQFAAGVCPPVLRWYGDCIQSFVADRPMPAVEGRLFA